MSLEKRLINVRAHTRLQVQARYLRYQRTGLIRVLLLLREDREVTLVTAKATVIRKVLSGGCDAGLVRDLYH